MVKNFFKRISEFNISGKPIPEDVADKILEWHIFPMQRVRENFSSPIWASQKSGYRSPHWERTHGRSGNSQHCFRGMGAVDWTCKHFPLNKAEFLKKIIDYTDYTRIAMYNGFIHCDYKPTKSGHRELYSSDSASNWKFKRFV